MTYNHRAPAPSCTYGNTSGQDVPPHMLLMRCADSVFHVSGQFQRIQVPKSVVVGGAGDNIHAREEWQKLPLPEITSKRGC